MPEDQTELPHLGPDERDRSVAILRTVAGLVPGAGGVLSEIISHVIPNQRIDRVEKFLTILAKKLDELGGDDLAGQLNQPENLALVEEGILQASRALTGERIARIAACVANGISAEQVNEHRSQRILDILRATIVGVQAGRKENRKF